MRLTTEQQKTLNQVIRTYVSAVINIDYRSDLSIEKILQVQTKAEALIKELCGNSDEFLRFWRHPPSKTSKWNEQQLYKFWSLVHEPEQIAKELEWIKKDLDMARLDERSDEKQILAEIKQTTLQSWHEIFERVMKLHMDNSKENELQDSGTAQQQQLATL